MANFINKSFSFKKNYMTQWQSDILEIYKH